MEERSKQWEILEKLLGNPLPEIDEIYLKAAEKYNQYTENKIITPYLLKVMFDEEEMQMVTLLPGTAKDVSEKMKLDEKYVEGRLHHMFLYGRILPGKDYHVDITSYAPNYSPVLVRDRVSQSMNGRGDDWNENNTLLQLINYWCVPIDDDPAVVEKYFNFVRIIPKYESIKTLPGVMPYENIKEIFNKNLKENTFSSLRCVCREHEQLKKGKDYLVDDCKRGIQEHGMDGKDGVCFHFGIRAEYHVKYFGGYLQTDREYVMKKLEELEKLPVIYTTPNRRSVNFICTCCDDCCIQFQYHNKGCNVFVPSRFRPKVNDDRCIGCTICSGHCNFNAISFENGKCRINPETCKGCGCCVVACPKKALKMEIVHEIDWIPDFYKE